MVTVYVIGLPGLTVPPALELFVTDRFATGVTVNVPVEGTLVPPLVVDTVTVFGYEPFTAAVMSTVMVHVPPTAIVPPEKLNNVAPATGAKVGEPQPVMVTLGVVATCIPVRVSLKPTPVSATVLTTGLLMTILSVLVPPGRMGLGENDLTTSGGVTPTYVAE